MCDEVAVEEEVATIDCHSCGDTIPESDGVEACGHTRCQSCHDEDIAICERCEDEYEAEDSCSVEVRNRRGRNVTQHWCSSCSDDYSFRCTDCGDRYDTDQAIETEHDGHVCQDCYENHYFTCDSCNQVLHNDQYHSDGHCQDCHKSNSWSSRQAYHCTGPIQKISIGNRRGFIGMEMEVGEISDLEGFGSEYDNHLGSTFAHPTEDGSLDDDTGTEFVGNAWCILKHLDSHSKYRRFITLLDHHGGNVSNYPSGCHHNLHFEMFNGRDALNRAIRMAFRFMPAFMLFTHERKRSYRISSYCRDIELGDDPITSCMEYGKMCAVNIKRHDELVEFRFCGMDLDEDRLLAQTQMIHNLVAFCNDDDCDMSASFSEVCLPIIGQDCVTDVIEKGETL